MKVYTNNIEEKCLELKKMANGYAEQLNQTVDGYEKKLSEL